MGYGHYHVEIINKDDLIEVAVDEITKNKHRVVDWLGELTGELDKVLGEYKTAEEAVEEAIHLLKKKMPDGQIVYGAGCPPNEWIDKVTKQNGSNKLS